MLSTTQALFALSLAALFSAIGCFLYINIVASKVYGCFEYVQTQNKNAISLKKMAEVEATLTELTDAYDALLSSHKKLRSRIGMRANRAQTKSDELPDPQTDPAGYKRAMRLKLNGKLGN